MFFMSTSVVLCRNLILSKKSISFSSGNALFPSVQLSCVRRKSCGLVTNAKKRHSKKRKWWQRFFFDEEGNWLGLRDEDVLEVLDSEEESSDDELSENEKFEAWKRRAEAIVELREAQEDVKNEENRRWEDWIVGDDVIGDGESWSQNFEKSGDDVGEQISEFFSSRGLVKSVRDLVLGREDDDILYEDRVFRYASFNSAKFLAIVLIVPWALDFLVHDYVLMPFLDRYVKTVPLAAQMLDIRRNQKLEIVKSLNVEKARYRLEVEIGKSPPLSDEELYLELRHRALELRDEYRLENRKAFANIWSDVVFGVSLFALIYFYQSQSSIFPSESRELSSSYNLFYFFSLLLQAFSCFFLEKVSLLKFTGYKILNNITDSGKAFLIILITDIFLGYHSESGWQTLLEVLAEHYGLEVDAASITIFVCLIPVVMDACVKLWLFKFLPRISPKVANIFQEMKRH